MAMSLATESSTGNSPQDDDGLRKQSTHKQEVATTVGDDESDKENETDGCVSRTNANAVNDDERGEKNVANSALSDEPTIQSPTRQPQTSHIPNDDNDDDTLPPVSGPNRTYAISELFINPNLQRKSANIVLRKDPFCIPRVTDNVREYRPPFNPLNILVSEEKLLPRNFTFDFSEEIPGDIKPYCHDKGHAQRRRDSKIDEDDTAPSYKKPRTASATSDNSSHFGHKIAPLTLPTKTFGDKLSTMGMLMGTLPRQQQQTSPVLIPTSSTLHTSFRGPPLENKTTSINTNALPSSNSSSYLHQHVRELTGNEVVEVVEPAPQHYPQENGPPLNAMARMTLALDSGALGMNAGPTDDIGLSSISISPCHVPRAFSSPSLSTLAGATPRGSDQLMRFLPDRQFPATWFTEKHTPASHYMSNEFHETAMPMGPTYQPTLAPTYHPTHVPACV